ncbi:conserved phage C-terminal domain-containing protein [Enterococcus mundtii]|uniref:conserved phage C-terminal domain-containing protein n=1 Tax=Enterococcus mundtii TaxID=53346 RepID=UPI001376F797|nr:conserved phage C-terminal domain-containing protein [Enterococcus mundtii]NBA63323.1 alpha/beta hydrolase [Enterococcus mundtii]
MQRAYYAIIPANVRYDKELPANAKLLYGEITALCNERGFCWASNNYFADLYGVSKVSISKWIKKLVENGYINSDIHYKEGSKEIEYRYLTLVNDPIKQKLNTPIKQKFKDNNTSFNNTNNNNMSSSEKVPFKKIIDHLNQVTGSRFSSKSSDTQKHIKARWNEGNTFEDFISVIDVKNNQWKDNPEMSKYLRPSTLFSAKNFENYKGEAVAEKKKENQKAKVNDIDLNELDKLFGDVS